MNEIRDLYNAHCFLGYRRITVLLKRQGRIINKKKVLRLMRQMRIKAVYPKKKLSNPDEANQIHPYLLRDKPPKKPNDCWAVDITYIKICGGYLYLTALIDWISRRIMGWNLSSFLDTSSCLEALNQALKEEKPEIVNTDQGTQFTSKCWIEVLQENGIKISMDGKGRCIDNIHIERFWRSLKYEEVYLKSYESVPEAREEIGEYIKYYNEERPHQSLGYQTPNEIHFGKLEMAATMPLIQANY